MFEEEYTTLDELLDSKEFNDFMEQLESEGYFDEADCPKENLADTGRFPEL